MPPSRLVIHRSAHSPEREPLEPDVLHPGPYPLPGHIAHTVHPPHLRSPHRGTTHTVPMPIPIPSLSSSAESTSTISLISHSLRPSPPPLTGSSAFTTPTQIQTPAGSAGADPSRLPIAIAVGGASPSPLPRLEAQAKSFPHTADLLGGPTEVSSRSGSRISTSHSPTAQQAEHEMDIDPPAIPEESASPQRSVSDRMAASRERLATRRAQMTMMTLAPGQQGSPASQRARSRSSHVFEPEIGETSREAGRARTGDLGRIAPSPRSRRHNIVGWAPTAPMTVTPPQPLSEDYESTPAVWTPTYGRRSSARDRDIASHSEPSAFTFVPRPDAAPPASPPHEWMGLIGHFPSASASASSSTATARPAHTQLREQAISTDPTSEPATMSLTHARPPASFGWMSADRPGPSIQALLSDRQNHMGTTSSSGESAHLSSAHGGGGSGSRRHQEQLARLDLLRTHIGTQRVARDADWLTQPPWTQVDDMISEDSAGASDDSQALPAAVSASGSASQFGSGSGSSMSPRTDWVYGTPSYQSLLPAQPSGSDTSRPVGRFEDGINAVDIWNQTVQEAIHRRAAHVAPPAREEAPPSLPLTTATDRRAPDGTVYVPAPVATGAAANPPPASVSPSIPALIAARAASTRAAFPSPRDAARRLRAAEVEREARQHEEAEGRIMFPDRARTSNPHTTGEDDNDDDDEDIDEEDDEVVDLEPMLLRAIAAAGPGGQPQPQPQHQDQARSLPRPPQPQPIPASAPTRGADTAWGEIPIDTHSRGMNDPNVLYGVNWRATRLPRAYEQPEQRDGVERVPAHPYLRHYQAVMAQEQARAARNGLPHPPAGPAVVTSTRQEAGAVPPPRSTAAIDVDPRRRAEALRQIQMRLQQAQGAPAPAPRPEHRRDEPTLVPVQAPASPPPALGPRGDGFFLRTAQGQALLRSHLETQNDLTQTQAQTPQALARPQARMQLQDAQHLMPQRVGASGGATGGGVAHPQPTVPVPAPAPAGFLSWERSFTQSTVEVQRMARMQEEARRLAGSHANYIRESLDSGAVPGLTGRAIAQAQIEAVQSLIGTRRARLDQDALAPFQHGQTHTEGHPSLWERAQDQGREQEQEHDGLLDPIDELDPGYVNAFLPGYGLGGARSAVPLPALSAWAPPGLPGAYDQPGPSSFAGASASPGSSRRHRPFPFVPSAEPDAPLYTSRPPSDPQIEAYDRYLRRAASIPPLRITPGMTAAQIKALVLVVVRSIQRLGGSCRKAAAVSVLGHVAWGAWADGGDLTSSMDKEAFCSVCHDDYEEDSKVTVTPCRHMYHKDCFDMWLDQPGRSSCPMCRRDLAVLAALQTLVPNHTREEAMALWLKV